MWKLGSDVALTGFFKGMWCEFPWLYVNIKHDPTVGLFDPCMAFFFQQTFKLSHVPKRR